MFETGRTVKTPTYVNKYISMIYPCCVKTANKNDDDNMVVAVVMIITTTQVVHPDATIYTTVLYFSSDIKYV
jgi:hypothetical protein